MLKATLAIYLFGFITMITFLSIYHRHSLANLQKAWGSFAVVERLVIGGLIWPYATIRILWDRINGR